MDEEPKKAIRSHSRAIPPLPLGSFLALGSHSILQVLGLQSSYISTLPSHQGCPNPDPILVMLVEHLQMDILRSWLIPNSCSPCYHPVSPPPLSLNVSNWLSSKYPSPNMADCLPPPRPPYHIILLVTWSLSSLPTPYFSTSPFYWTTASLPPVHPHLPLDCRSGLHTSFCFQVLPTYRSLTDRMPEKSSWAQFWPDLFPIQNPHWAHTSLHW